MNQTNKFGSVEELSNIINSLDIAEKRGLSTTVNEVSEPVPYYAVWNTTKGQIESVIPEKRGLITHQEAFRPLVNVLQKENYEVNGSVKNLGGDVIIECFMPKLRREINGDFLKVGFRIKNSYTARYPRFSGEAFGFREKCANGMMLNKVLHITIVHEKVADLEKDFLEFMNRIFDNVTELDKRIEKAQEEKMTEKEMERVLKSEIRGKKRVVQILDIIKNNQGDSRWELYNAVTQYATHNVTKEHTKKWLQNKAQDILIAPKKKLLKKAVEVE